nr:MAG TPA: hypothetical protein [Herelleviridae sp.]
MGVEKKFIMRQLNENGTDYDILYPKTTADQIENIYTENQILSSGTTSKYQLPTDSLPDAVFNKLLEAMPWALIQEYKTAGAYTWTAPDLYNGASYKIGVYMVGGGGSGAAGVESSNHIAPVSGGGSGFAKNLIFDISPGQKISCVVGSGGASKSGAGNGNNGGSTSFNGVTVSGGDGGHIGSDSASGANGGQGSDAGTLFTETNVYLYGGCPATSSISFSSTGFVNGLANFGRSQPSRESQNWFDTSMVTLAAGGSPKQTMLAMPDGTKGGDGASGAGAGTFTAQSATGNGNGGGAAWAGRRDDVAGTPVAGAGSQGMILIYARAT